MGKLLKILLAIVIILAILSSATYFFIFRTSMDIATLNIKQQKVEVNTGKEWKSATDMDLSLSDKVKTLDGKALIILYESILINLKENTEVSIQNLIKEKPVVKQESGTTWSKFAGLSGVESYEVQTPNTIATVRGTSFMSRIEGTSSTFIVGEGNIQLKADDETLTITTLEKAVRKGKEPIKKVALTKKEREEMILLMKETLEDLKRLRKKEIQKHSIIINRAMKRYGVTEKELEGYLEQIDKGEIDDAELIEKSPVKLKAMYKIKNINDKIKEHKRLIESLNEGNRT